MSSVCRFVRRVLTIAALGVCALLVVAVSMAQLGSAEQPSTVIPPLNTASLMPAPSLVALRIPSGNAVNIILAGPGGDGNGDGNRGGRGDRGYGGSRGDRDYRGGGEGRDNRGGGEGQICHRGRGHEENWRCGGDRESTNCQDWGHKRDHGYRRDQDCPEPQSYPHPVPPPRSIPPPPSVYVLPPPVYVVPPPVHVVSPPPPPAPPVVPAVSPPAPPAPPAALAPSPHVVPAAFDLTRLWRFAVALILLGIGLLVALLVLLASQVQKGQKWVRAHVHVVAGAAPSTVAEIMESRTDRSPPTCVVRIQPHADSGTQVLEGVYQ
jgi:hypothetical protein